MKTNQWIGWMVGSALMCVASTGWAQQPAPDIAMPRISAREDTSGSFMLEGALINAPTVFYEYLSATSNPPGIQITSQSGQVMVSNNRYNITQSYTLDPDYCNDALMMSQRPLITYTLASTNVQSASNTQKILLNVYFDVTCVNDTPVPENLALTVVEDMALQVMLKATDPDMNDMLTYSITTMPSSGMLTGTAPNLVYRPNMNFTGLDTFGFEVEDSTGAKAIGQVSITVSPVNDPPIVLDQQINIAQDMMASINLTATDPENDMVSFAITKQPSNGSLMGTAPSFQYTPTAGFSGMDTIKFRATDASGAQSEEATITINIGNVNDPPMFIDPTPADMASFMINEGQDFSIKIAASDPDGDMLTLAMTGLPPKATFDATTGDFKWKPDYTDKGDYTIVASVKDSGEPLTRTFSLKVNIVDDDNDLIPSTLEEKLGLKPNSNDSDGDRISDLDEVGSDFENPLDSNNNGIIDALDLDSDGDGLTDAQEAGDESVETKPVDSDGDGQPDYRDKDSDNDMVEDSNDNCKLKRNTDQKDTDGDGKGDVCDEDLDNDGLSNALDSCPDVAAMTANGCPAPAPKPKTDDEGCASTGAKGSAPSALLMGLMAGLMFWRRRRRA